VLEMVEHFVCAHVVEHLLGVIPHALDSASCSSYAMSAL
jgi:hypothetical protein